MSFTAKLKATVCFILLGTALQAQVAIGTWKSFMPFSSAVGMCNAGDKLYVACNKSIYSYEKETGLFEFFDKSNMLSDVDVKTICYDAGTNGLVVAYANGNIDLIFNDSEVYNLRDILIENSSTSIGINHLYINNGNCYLSSDIGISVINLSRKEITNTYIIGSTGSPVKVNATTINGNYIYAATADGVKYAPVNSTNLQDFNAWSLFTPSQGIPSQNATLVAGNGSKVYASIKGLATDTLYEYDGSNWTQKYFATGETFSNLETVNGTLHYSIWNNNNTTAGKQGTIDAGTGAMNTFNTTGHVRPINWFSDNGKRWEADYWNGFFKQENGNVQNLNPNGPFNSTAYDLETGNDGTLYVAAGGVDDSYGSTYNSSGFYIKRGIEWENRNIYTDGILNEMFDLISVANNDAKGKTYFASFYMGLVEYDHNSKSIVIYNKDNAAFLEKTQGDTGRTRLSALNVDANGNLWIFNGGGLRPLKVVKPDGSWKDYTTSTSLIMKRMLFDRNGQLWAPIRTNGSGLYVRNFNGTLDNESDDKQRILGTGAGNGALPDAVCYCVVEDKDGNIWVGTNQGIATFYCGSNVMNGCDADLITVERDGYLGYLFGNETVRALAVDAANRKWVGTTNGLWLISADGKTELLKFTVENSPLPANQITDIEIDDASGEVYIATTNGIVSYQGDAIAHCDDCDGALVYPNPVKPDYAGPIAIKGLAEDAYVKITDATGTLVFQGKANGSQMVWDGKGYNGTKAKSGVYLVFSSTQQGKDREVAKIVLLN
ncbi:MAG: hypothetical protein JST49_14250 [Bacteroidetes bacterium]|nr:hypothetical protein [Bacteroidota bacterium]